MKQFLDSQRSNQGLLKIAGFLFIISFFGGYIPLVGLWLFKIASFCFLFFIIYVLKTTTSPSKIWKIFLWIILILTFTPVIWESIYFYTGPGGQSATGFLSGFVIMIGFPLLLLGLVALFKSEKK